MACIAKIRHALQYLLFIAFKVTFGQGFHMHEINMSRNVGNFLFGQIFHRFYGECNVGHLEINHLAQDCHMTQTVALLMMKRTFKVYENPGQMLLKESYNSLCRYILLKVCF